MLRINTKEIFISVLLLLLIFGVSARKSVFAQESSTSVLFVPLIGITSVPDPLTLPAGAGTVTFRYAVRNFLPETALDNIQVTDDGCNPVKFVNGDTNNDSKLDSDETWRYACAASILQTTKSIATATGTANNITAKHIAYSTVIVGSGTPPPLVSIVNITKVPNPLPLPLAGNNITSIYKVTNPGVAPLGGVVVVDDKCSDMSGKLGDTNANNLLDIDEGWIYTCSTRLSQTTTENAKVMAFANGMSAIDNTSLTINVEIPAVVTPPLFDVAISPDVQTSSNFKIIVWIALSSVLGALVIAFFVLTGKNLSTEIREKLSWAKSRLRNNHDESPS